MNKTVRIILSILLALVIIGGIGFLAYRLGYARGVASSSALLEALNNQNPDRDAVYPYMMYGMRGMHAPFMMHGMRMGGSLFGGLLGFIGLVLLIGLAVRFIFFPRRMHPGWYGWGPHPGQPPAAEPTQAKKEE